VDEGDHRLEGEVASAVEATTVGDTVGMLQLLEEATAEGTGAAQEAMHHIDLVEARVL